MTLCIVLEWLLLLPHSHAAEGSRELPWYLICCYENSEFHCSKNSFFPNSYQNPIVVLLLVDLFDGFAIIMIFPALLSWICLIYTVSGIQKGKSSPSQAEVLLNEGVWRSIFFKWNCDGKSKIFLSLSFLCMAKTNIGFIFSHTVMLLPHKLFHCRFF